MNNKEIPNIIFEYINQKSFEKLSQEQKVEVLNIISEETYTELHIAATNVHMLNTFRKETFNNENRKEELLLSFKKQNTKLKVLQYPVQIWKVASVILLLTSIFFIFAKNQSTKNTIVYIEKKDTIYIETAKIAAKIIDTIFAKTDENRHQNKNKIMDKKWRNFNQKQVLVSNNIKYNIENITPLNIISVKNIDKMANKGKNSSIKNDSFIHKFGFVTM